MMLHAVLLQSVMSHAVCCVSICSRDRDRSASVIVRKRSASFRKIARQKRKEEAKDDSKLTVSMYSNYPDSMGPGGAH